MVKDETRRQMVRELTQAGWRIIRSDGGHDVYGCPCGRHIAPLPRHRVVSPGVVRKIRQAIAACAKGA